LWVGVSTPEEPKAYNPGLALASFTRSATLFQGLSTGTLSTLSISVREPMATKSWRVAPGVRP
jgi:hypothetical protein